MKLTNLAFKEVTVKPYKEANLFYTTEDIPIFWSDDYGFNDYEVRIPKGFITDLSSAYKVPFLGKKKFKMDTGNQTLGCLHDYLCSKAAVVYRNDRLYTPTKQTWADDTLCAALRFQYDLTNGKSGASAFQAKLIKLAISRVKWHGEPVKVFNERKQVEEIIE